MLTACASTSPSEGWTTLIDGGKGLANFDRVGEANWSATDGAVQASAGTPPASFLVTRTSYKDVMVRAEFWSSDDANSGIFLRCQDPKTITDENCYEANIFDQRPDPTYATGAIVKVAKLTAPMIKAGGQWNTMEVTAKGSRLDRRVERHEDGGHRRQQTRQRPDRTAVGARHDQVPQGAGQADLIAAVGSARSWARASGAALRCHR